MQSMRDPRVVQTIAQNHKHLSTIHVHRITGGEHRPVGSIPLSDADGVAVEHGNHPGLDAGELADAVQKLARVDVQERGAGTYEATLCFAMPPRGQPKRDVTVQWHQGASIDEETDEADLMLLIRRYSLQSWRDHHEAHMSTIGVLQTMGQLMAESLRAANEMMLAAAERERSNTSDQLQIEMIRAQQETERMRTNVAVQALTQLTAGTKGTSEAATVVRQTIGAAFAAPPEVDTSRDALVDAARELCQSITPGQIDTIARGHDEDAIRRGFASLSRVETREDVRHAWKVLHDALGGDYAGLVAALSPEQVNTATTIAREL